MAKWNEGANWTPFDDINGGQQFSNALTPEDLNSLAENIAYLYAHQGENEYLGAYAGGNYRAGAIVKYSDGNIYLCIKDTDDEQEPTNATYWQMLNTASSGEEIPEISAPLTLYASKEGAEEGELVIAYDLTEKVALPAATNKRLGFIEDANYIAENIRSGRTIFGLAGEYEGEGGGEVIPEYTEVEDFVVFASAADEGSLELGYSVSQDVKLSAPSGGASAVQFDSLEDDNFVPWNIKSGVSIFGMTGEYEGSPLPTEVSTEAEMTALLTSGEIGGVYKYTGTTGTYENGALYVLEEEAESIVGTWVFNGEITGLLSQTNVSFESNEKTYSSISCVDSGFGLQVKYDSTIVCGKLVANEWVSDTYKTIIITSEPTDEAFITWLKANATKQGATSLITFTIDGTSYEAEDGMTWAEWCESEYESPDVVMVSGSYIVSGGSYLCTSNSISAKVLATDTITQSTAYYLVNNEPT